MPGMEPRIQYARTSDGLSIAHWSLGDGTTIVMPPPAMPWSHVELEWQVPDWRHLYEHLAETTRVIRYDGRGAGLSDRPEHIDFSLDCLLLDLDAVVERLGAGTFALFGCYGAGAIAIEYAARHPERVSHLMLWCAFSRGSDASEKGEFHETMRRLITVDYEMFTETLAHSVFGWDEGQAAHLLAQYMQAALPPDLALQCWTEQQDVDLDDRLPKIQAPTLVMHRREFPILGVEVARRIAARIPDARLKILDGRSLSPYMGDIRATLDVINDFLGVDLAGQAPRQKQHPHATGSQAMRQAISGGFRTIMFTDMEGSTALTQRLGDEDAQSRVRLHNQIVRDSLDEYGGTQIKHTGDGIMASFPTASGAVDCAVAIQRAIAEHNEAHPGEQVLVRIGINAGEPVAEGDDLFGTAVQLASRVCATAEPSEILTTDVVRQLVAGKGFLFADRGTANLRGFEDPVRTYEVRWRYGA